MNEEMKIKIAEVDVLKRFVKILANEGYEYVDQLAELSFKEFLSKFGTNTQRLDAIAIAVNQYFPKAKVFTMSDVIKVFDDIFFLYCQPINLELFAGDDTYTITQLTKIRSHAFKHVKDNIDESKIVSVLPYFNDFQAEYGLLKKYVTKEAKPYFGLLTVAFKNKCYEKEGIKNKVNFAVEFKAKIDEQFAKGIIDRKTLVKIYKDMGFIQK
jgi:predicted ATP-dependent Lon-type protease